MGSRVMHAIISYKIAEKLHIQDQVSFIHGGIAADAAIHNKDASHFYIGSHEDFTRDISYENFADKYRHVMNHPYIQGYYAHLISDQIWLTGFYLPWLKNRMEASEETFQKYHGDFRKLNSLLANHYEMKETLLTTFNKEASIVELSEVSSTEVKSFKQDVCNDLTEEHGSTLEVFTFDQMVGYVETCIQKACYRLQT